MKFRRQITVLIFALAAEAPQPIGIRLPGGSRTYDTPAEAKDVPGPIQSLLLPAGTWLGKVPAPSQPWHCHLAD